MADWNMLFQGQRPAGGYAAAQPWQGAGRNNNADKLNDFLYNGGRNLSIQDRAWCADFMNATLKAGGGQGTGSGAARSFLNWGQPTDKPNPGDVAVFSHRSDPASGHVGYFQGANPDGSISVLSGNQGGQVGVGRYPASRLLGYRTASSGGGALTGADGPQIADAFTARADSRQAGRMRLGTTDQNAFSDYRPADINYNGQVTWGDGTKQSLFR